MIRQVFQHSSNKEIQEIIDMIHQYRYLILRKYMPGSLFTPKIDHPTGAYSRLARGIKSVIVHTKPLVNLRFRNKRIICEMPEQTCFPKAILYES